MKSRMWMTVGAAVFLAAAWMGAASCSQPAGGSEGGGTGTAWREPEPEQAPAGEREEQLQWYSEKLEECRTSEEFLGMLDQFSYRSASALLAGGENSANENYSPLSLYYALGMTAAGAEGETLEELGALLGTEDREALADGCRRLYENIYYSRKLQDLYGDLDGVNGEGGKRPSASLANSLWVDWELEIKDSYAGLLEENYYAPAYQVSFDEKETWEQMGRWISDHTEGVMEPELPMDSRTLLALINTLYYYGAWAEEFPASETEEEEFHREDGSTSRGEFMHVSVSDSAYREGDGWKTASLGIRGSGRMDEMVFVLPDEGTSVEELLASPERLEEALDMGTGGRPVNWTVPKFSFGSSIDGNELLMKLGVERMFTEEAQFPGISDRSLQVSKVLQETHIGLDEKGVEGAAYTVVMMMETAAALDPAEPVEMRLDRPFLYGIRSQEGGWLFLGVVRDPFAG